MLVNNSQSFIERLLKLTSCSTLQS